MGTAWTCVVGGAFVAAASVVATIEVAGPDAVSDAMVKRAVQNNATDSGINMTVPELSGAEKPGFWKSFHDMHAHYTHQFVEAEGFGISRIVTFHEPEFRQLFVNGKPHRVQSLRLIGLNEEAPVVYLPSWVGVSRRQLEQYPKRVLIESELAAIKQLKEGREFVWQPLTESNSSKETDQLPGKVMMPAGRLVAGLRATDSCTSCHDVKEGTLLGAFVYEMFNAERLPQPLLHLPSMVNTPSKVEGQSQANEQ